MVFSPLTPETLPGHGLAVVALHLPLQHIRERGRAVEQWRAVGRSNGAMLLQHHRYSSTVAVSPFP